MKAGKIMVINCDSMVPYFMDDYNSKLLPLKDLLFDQSKMYDKETKVYKGILRPEEDKDDEGNKGMYFMRDTFMVLILANMADPDTDDEIIQMLLDQVPHHGKMQKYFVTD